MSEDRNYDAEFVPDSELVVPKLSEKEASDFMEKYQKLLDEGVLRDIDMAYRMRLSVTEFELRKALMKDRIREVLAKKARSLREDEHLKVSEIADILLESEKSVRNLLRFAGIQNKKKSREEKPVELSAPLPANVKNEMYEALDEFLKKYPRSLVISIVLDYAYDKMLATFVENEKLQSKITDVFQTLVS